LRGRRLALGLPGFDDLTLSEFLDLVWADAYDDVGDLTDRRRYREAMHHILILGEDPPVYDDDDDKPRSKRKPKPPRRKAGKRELDDALAKAREIRERAMQTRAKTGK
jgi:hypothetical protein